MRTKRALIVDDSKSARVVMTRLLEKHDLAVETRETAEGALEYLERNEPDVIFMDHVMPGMDGLSAVQLIKKDSRFAKIPVLMYTSQEGDVYAQAAKASGADAVLPKQMSSADISDALIRLKVLPSRVVLTDETAATPAAPSLSAADVRAAVEPMVREQGGELRRVTAAAIDGIPDRVVADVGKRLEAAVSELLERLTPPPPVPPPRPWGLIGALNVAVVVAAVFAVLFWRGAVDVAHLQQTIDRQAATIAAGSVSATDAQPKTVWPSEHHALGYGEAPFTAARIAQADRWISALEKSGFVGSVRLVVSLADYCLTGNPGEGYSLAPGDLVAAKCDLRGSPPDDTRAAVEREPAAVTALLKDVASRTHGEIDGRIVYTKAAGYPGDGAPSAEWNSAASQGHFLEFVAQPRAR